MGSAGIPPAARRFRSGRKRGRGAFILLEILLATALLGIALAAMLRCYTNGLKALSEDRRVAVAVFLAQGVLEDFETEAPENDHVEGTFGADFPNFSYVADFENVEVKYRNLELRVSGMRFDPLRKVTLIIYYRPPNAVKASQEVRIETYLTGIEKFSQRTKELNALF
jgi:type II secretory pathway pseudopilin PulG